jgi:hypothetical protein
MREELGHFHPNFVYKEQPGAGHWWGNLCCDWPPMFGFFADHEIPPAEQVEQIRFVTPSPAISPNCFWVTVAAQEKSGQPSRVSLRFDRPNRTLSGTTENVRQLAIRVDSLRGGVAKNDFALLGIDLDGVKLPEIPGGGSDELWLERDQSQWRVGAEPESVNKGIQRCGPFKEAFRNRFMLVYGTGGTADENAWMFERARFDAETFWYRGNGSVDVISDAMWKDVAEVDRNVIVYGNGSINSAWNELLSGGPLVVRSGQWQFDHEPQQTESVAVWLIRPRSDSKQASVAAIGGSDILAMRATNRAPVFSSGTGLPDLLVVSPNYLDQGVASVKLAGYFGYDWSVQNGEWVRAPKPEADDSN